MRSTLWVGFVVKVRYALGGVDIFFSCRKVRADMRDFSSWS